MKVFAVIPAYNEAKRIGKVIEKAKRYVDQVVVVDDGSSDDTSVVSERYGVTVLRHVINLGKGAGLKTGAEYALSQGADAFVFIDSDGQHDPTLIPKFFKLLEHNDIVFGYRSFSKEMPFVFRFGNWFLNTWTKLLFGMALRDTQSGYRALRADAYRRIKWESTSYSVESEMIANAGKRNLRFAQIPIPTIYNDRHKGTTPVDGVKIALDMLIWRMRR